MQAEGFVLDFSDEESSEPGAGQRRHLEPVLFQKRDPLPKLNLFTRTGIVDAEPVSPISPLDVADRDKSPEEAVIENNEGSICYNCLEPGHTKDECPYAGKACFLCGHRGHEKCNCPYKICGACGKFGHGSKGCMVDRTGLYRIYKGTRCFHCGGSHSTFLCSNIRNASTGGGDRLCVFCGSTEHRWWDCGSDDFGMHHGDSLCYGGHNQGYTLPWFFTSLWHKINKTVQEGEGAKTRSRPHSESTSPVHSPRGDRGGNNAKNFNRFRAGK